MATTNYGNGLSLRDNPYLTTDPLADRDRVEDRFRREYNMPPIEQDRSEQDRRIIAAFEKKYKNQLKKR